MSEQPLPFSHGPWVVNQRRQAYADPWLQTYADEVTRPDGEPGSYSFTMVKPGVTVLALDDQGVVHLAEEFHYAVGRVTLEAVSGGREPGEEPIDAARRELAEELGLSAAQWTHLGAVDPLTSNVCSPTQLFLAEQLSHGEPSPDGGEVIVRREFPLEEAVAMTFDGRITHGPSCVAILKTALLCGDATQFESLAVRVVDQA